MLEYFFFFKKQNFPWNFARGKLDHAQYKLERSGHYINNV
jgi:hypothetical protein